MSDKYLLAEDTISGQEGKAYATIDGQNILMFYAKKVTAEAEKIKKEVKTIGNRITQHKASGVKCTGTMTIYYMTSQFRKMMAEYIKTGKDTYFDMMVINDDPTAGVGKQTAVLRHVNLDKVVMAQFDTDSESLEEEIGFTYSGVDYLDEFTAPSYISE